MSFIDQSLKQLSLPAFEALGADAIGYVKILTFQEAQSIFPDLPMSLITHIDFYTLFSADGAPLIIADSKESVTEGAQEFDLEIVFTH